MNVKFMLIQKAFRYELRPDGATRRAFNRFAGAKRFVWNKALSLPKWEGRFKTNPLLRSWKTEFSWLYEIHSQVLQSAIVDLDSAFKNFFGGRAGRPVKKKKWKCRDSFRYPQGFQIEEGNSRIYLPKIGWVRYRCSRPLEGVARNVTVSRHADKWFVSIQTEFEIAEPKHPSSSRVGVDLGVCHFAAISDGTFVESLNALRKHEFRLRRYQRMMSRKTKFSKNWKKAKARVAKLHEEAANSRRDFLHKLTTEQTKTHSLICIEDLKVGNMSRSVAGTVDEPGSNVERKSGLNRSILDQGWAEYRRQLKYKMKRLGGKVIAVAAMNTSRKCPSCGHVCNDNRKTQAAFLCVECGFAANADYVASLNIFAAGLAVFEGSSFDDACGGVVEVRPPMKQEPTERAA